MELATAPTSRAGFCPYAYALHQDKRVIALRNQIPLMGGPVAWIDLAYTGAWQGHRSGPFAFDDLAFATIINNFNRQTNPVPLDYDHEREILPPPWPARGWVHELKLESLDGKTHLLAQVEFGAEAAEYVRTGAYPYSSGVFDFEAVDRVTGNPIGIALTSIALCADPFIDGQQPIRLSRAASTSGVKSMSQTVDKAELISHLRKLDGDSVSDSQVQQLAAALGMLAAAKMPPEAPEEDKPAEAAPAPAEGEPEAPPEEEEKAAASKAAASAALAAPESAPAPAPEAPQADQAKLDASAAIDFLMSETGMDLQALCAALKSMQSSGMPAAPAPLSNSAQEAQLALSARDHTIRALSQRVEAAETEVRRYLEREADDAVGVLIDSGRLLDTSRSEMREVYLTNRKLFDKLSTALPEIVPVGKHAEALTPPTEHTPAINEDDPEVKQLRRWLDNTRMTQAQKDAAVRTRLSARKESQTRV